MEEDPNDTSKSFAYWGNVILKSSAVFHLVEGYKYAAKIGNANKTTVVGIFKCMEPGKLSSNWLLRFDRPHKGANYPHLNIRHKFTGIKDPHLKLPPGSLQVAQAGTYFCKIVDYLQAYAVVYDACRLGLAMHKDYNKGTTENSVECAKSISCEWLGGFVGGSVGGCIGTFILPFGGSVTGALAGSALGVHYSACIAEKLIHASRQFMLAGIRNEN